MKVFRTSVAVFMLAVFAAWQLGALVHFATVAHELCPHGQVVDAVDHHHEHDHDHSHDADPSNHGHDGHDDCRIVASITQARADVGSEAPAAALVVPLEVIAAPVETDLQFLPTDDLYLTAPSHSPPVA
jgi:hypothetical protein